MILRIEDVQTIPQHASLKARLKECVGSHRNDITYLRNKRGELAFIKGSPPSETEFFEIENSNEEQETRVCDEWIVTKLFPNEKKKVNDNNRIDDIPELIYVGEYSKIGEWDTVNSIFHVVEKFFAVKKAKKP